MDRSLSVLTRNHDTILTVVKILSACSAMLIPSSFPNRTVLLEGIYSLSQLLTFLGDEILRRNAGDSRMCNILRLVSLAVTQVEVFAEGVGRVLGDRKTRQLVILSLEGVKAVSRLGVLCSAPPDIMLLDWGKSPSKQNNAGSSSSGGGESKPGGKWSPPQLSDYLSHYRRRDVAILRRVVSLQAAAAVPVSQHSTPVRSTVYGAANNSSSSKSSPQSVTSQQSAGRGGGGRGGLTNISSTPYVGRRSGIVLHSAGGSARQSSICSSNTKHDDDTRDSADNDEDDDRLIKDRQHHSKDNSASNAQHDRPFSYCDIYGVQSGSGGEDDRFEHCNNSATSNHGGLGGTDWSTDACRPRIFSQDASVSDVDVESCDTAPQAPAGLGHWVGAAGTGILRQLLRLCTGLGGGDNSDSPSVVQSDEEEESACWTPERALRLGEVLYVLRPLVYVLILHHFCEAEGTEGTEAGDDEGSSYNGGSVAAASSPGCSSSKPSEGLRMLNALSRDTIRRALALAVSLIIECLSIQLTCSALAAMRRRARDGALRLFEASSRISSQTANESIKRHFSRESLKAAQSHSFDAEVGRRRMGLFFYLIRSPLFDRATYPVLRAATGVLRSVPIIGLLPETALSMLQYLNRTHFYNANSS